MERDKLLSLIYSMFLSNWLDETNPYTLKECEDGRFEFFGYKQKDE
ncbi:hypothetical protein [Clostridium sp. KNHs214]|nr:hypothetical protein [Clostridium sp. KNHs214]